MAGDSDEERIEKAKARYMDAVHAMQTGVGYYEHPGEGSQSPKHLRVGVNSAMVEHSVLVHLLVRKGLISLPEYYEALADGMEAERDRYKAMIKGKFGTNVELR